MTEPSPPAEPAKTLAQIARESGVSSSTVRMRKSKGQALEGPKRDTRGPRTCKKCGELGHMAKTCERRSS